MTPERLPRRQDSCQLSLRRVVSEREVGLLDGVSGGCATMLVESASSLCKRSAAPLVAYFRISCLHYASRSSSSRTSWMVTLFSYLKSTETKLFPEKPAPCAGSQGHSAYFSFCVPKRTLLSGQIVAHVLAEVPLPPNKEPPHTTHPASNPTSQIPQASTKRVVHRALRSCLEEDGASRKVFKKSDTC